MAAGDGECDYILDPKVPETWGGSSDDQCYVEEVWACPHQAHDTVDEGESSRSLCLFHLPRNRKDDDEVTNAFLDALSEANQSEDPEVTRRKQQFIGARLNRFDIGDTTILADEAFPVDLRHASFTNGATYELSFDELNEPSTTYEGAVNLSEATVTTDVNLRGATFEGDVLFWDGTIEGDLNLSGTVIDGDLVLSQSTIDGNLDVSGASFEDAHADVATLEGWVKFDGITAMGAISLNRTSIADDLYLRQPESLPEGARFDHASIAGSVFVEGRPYAEVDIGDGVVFNAAVVRDGIVFRKLTIDGELDFTDAFIDGPVDFLETTITDGAIFRELDFEDARFRDAEIPRADFRRTNLTEADLSGADLRGANLEQAILSRANLFKTDLRGAAMYGAVMGDAQINERTRFGEYCVYDDPDSINGPIAGTESDGTDVLAKAAAQYRTLEQLAQANAFPDQVREYFIRRKDVYRRQHAEAGRIARMIQATLSRHLWLYGESWQRILGTSATVIVAFGVLYTVTGGIHVSTQSATHAFDLPDLLEVSVSQSVGTLLLSLYFSVVTFTTLGYGDIQPTNPATQTLAGIESLVGAILIALLVFVLGRRATR